MDFEHFKALREQITRSAFSRTQLVELFGEVAGRVCSMEEPELESVQHDISDAHEQLQVALEEVEAREAQFMDPSADECTMAKDQDLAEAQR